MKKLYKIMKKYGLNFRPVHLGYSYFFGAEIAAEGAHIYLDNASAHGANFERLRRYCSRYGYVVQLFGVYPDCTVYSVRRCDDAAKMALYAMYADASRAECDKMIHSRHNGGYASDTDQQFNLRLRDIMARYEAAYLQAAKKANAA